MSIIAAIALTSCIAIDGDTVRCGADRYRLLGIDAPEMPGHCRRGRICAPGDPEASKRSLALALRRGPVTFQPVTMDRYGRAVGIVRAAGINLSCWQLNAAMAIYKPKWDNGRLVDRECPNRVPL